jgi:hypothetical protein
MAMRRTDPTRCPTCRERVSPYAAGCAFCGAELDIRRHDRVPVGRRLVSAWQAFSFRPDLVLAAIVLIVLLGWLTAGRI